MAKDAEERISLGVLQIAAAHPKGMASFNQCRAQIPAYVTLTAADLAPSTTRRGEPMWHQIVRNIKCHDQEDSNYINLGYLKHEAKRGYSITAAGRSRLSKP